MPVIVDQAERRPSWEARYIRIIIKKKEYIFLPATAILPSIVNETETMVFLCLRSLCTTAPEIKIHS
jgi:hypothetical protein